VSNAAALPSRGPSAGGAAAAGLTEGLGLTCEAVVCKHAAGLLCWEVTAHHVVCSLVGCQCCVCAGLASSCRVAAICDAGCQLQQQGSCCWWSSSCWYMSICCRECGCFVAANVWVCMGSLVGCVLSGVCALKRLLSRCLRWSRKQLRSCSIASGGTRGHAVLMSVLFEMHCRRSAVSASTCRTVHWFWLQHAQAQHIAAHSNTRFSSPARLREELCM
jgi:hypothetical protein